jgi:hypothetical protein
VPGRQAWAAPLVAQSGVQGSAAGAKELRGIG